MRPLLGLMPLDDFAARSAAGAKLAFRQATPRTVFPAIPAFFVSLLPECVTLQRTKRGCEVCRSFLLHREGYFAARFVLNT